MDCRHIKLVAFFLTFFWLFCCTKTGAQSLHIHGHKIGKDSVAYYADNQFHIDLGLKADAGKRKFKGAPEFPVYRNLPARTDSVLLFKAKSRKLWRKKKLTRRVRFEVKEGGVQTLVHDTDYVYALPYAPDSAYKIIQGYFGKFSHPDKKALDFLMPVGSPIHAARGGLVYLVKEDSDEGCPDPKCRGKANFISIMHADGSTAHYIHLQYQGSLVEAGEEVVRGQLIGYGGNTGYSTRPHLHFEVFIPGYEENETVETPFELAGGKQGIPKKGDFPRRP